MPGPLEQGVVAVLALLVTLAWMLPGARILRRMGYSGWWMVIAFVPIANLLALWGVAYSRWPALESLTPPAPPP